MHVVVTTALAELSSHPQPDGAPSAHRYALFDGDRHVGWLEWRSRPRSLCGWFLVCTTRPAVRLRVHPALDELSADTRSEAAFEAHADAAASLTTSFALDAAERAINPSRRRRPISPPEPYPARNHRIYIEGVEPDVLGRAVPELASSRLADVSVLEGVLDGDGAETVLRRVRLLGGQILAVLADVPGPPKG